jgi:uncharacterized protein YndB with AHSA1/START domain
MPVGTWTVVIDRSADEVFDYLMDMSKHHEWSPKPYSVEPLTDGPMSVGSRFRSVGWLPRQPNHVNEVEITKIDRPRAFAFTAYDQGQEFKSEFRLTPDDGGSGGSRTRVERVMDMPKPPGFAGVIFPVVFAMVVKPGVQKGMDMLKANLDRKA